MAEDLNTTPPDEPGKPTSDGGPVTDTDSGLSSPPQPTEDITARMARLEANLSGRSREAEEERRRRVALEDQLETMRRAQQQPAPQPQPTVPTYPSDGELAKALNRATIDGNDAEVERILSIQRTKTVSESEQRISQMIGQASAFSQQQQSYQNYLNSAGLKPGSALLQRTSEIEREISEDIKLSGQNSQYWFTGGNPAWIRSIAAERARSAAGTERGDALETVRRETAAGAGTESSSRGNGAPPGKNASRSTQIFLTPEEKKTAEKWFGGSAESAQKRYWENLDSWKREQRLSAGKAIV
jgi:hypothetical protein